VRTIAEMNLLIRACMELPAGLQLTTDQYRDGWELLQPEQAGELKRRMRTGERNLIRIGDGILKSGIGDTSQEAINCALKRALRMISERIPAVEVGEIKLMRYPWFRLARVTVFPYWIQQSSAAAVPDRATLLAPEPRRGPTPRQADALDSQFASAIPHLTQQLISSQGVQNDSR
jgi:hypothetical protein